MPVKLTTCNHACRPLITLEGSQPAWVGGPAGQRQLLITLEGSQLGVCGDRAGGGGEPLITLEGSQRDDPIHLGEIIPEAAHHPGGIATV